ncbi:MAG TPA: universal stress protein [Nocardioidaceae bacterium]|nr:universal stress protein [Nocardioidaceae bacterium]
MPDVLFAALVLVTWVAIGLAAAIYLGRHGRRSPAWFVIGIALGPILLPIALELTERRGVLLTRTVAPDGSRPASLTVLVAVDGSQESDDALADAARLLAPRGAQFVLLNVVDPDQSENDPLARRQAEELLAKRAALLPEGSLPAVHQVVSGEPATAIVDRAAAEAVDLVVLGRCGHGLSELLLGSVADHVVRRSPRPVFLGAASDRR